MTDVLQIIVAFLFFSSQVASSFIPRTTGQGVDFSGLPQCVSEHCSVDNAIADFGCNPQIQDLKDCICCSEAPFPWGSECSPDSRYVIEGWFRKTCPEVVPVSFDPLSDFIRDQIVFGSLERGCYSLSQNCFCNVSSSEALKYVISNCSKFDTSKARKWHRSLCGPEPEENTISATTAGAVLPINGSLATPTTSVAMVSSVVPTFVSTGFATISTNPSGTSTRSGAESTNSVPVTANSTPVIFSLPSGTTNSGTSSIGLVPVVAISIPPPPGTTNSAPSPITNSVPIITNPTTSITNLAPTVTISTPIIPSLPPGTPYSVPNSGTSSISLVPGIAISTPVVSSSPPSTIGSVPITISTATSSINPVPVVAISTPTTPILPPNTINSVPIVSNSVSSSANSGISSTNLSPGTTSTLSSTNFASNTAVTPTMSTASSLNTIASQTYVPAGPSSDTTPTPTTSSAMVVSNLGSSTGPIGDQTSSATPTSSNIDYMGGNATSPNESAGVGPPRGSNKIPCISKLSAALDQSLLFMGPNDPGAFFAMIFVVSLGCFMVTVTFYEWVAAC